MWRWAVVLPTPHFEKGPELSLSTLFIGLFPIDFAMYPLEL